MEKKILAVVLVLVVVLSTNIFAYRWVEYNNNWYVLDESKNEFLTSMLLDTVDNVYYLDREGKLTTGWWQNPTTKKYYFFDNKADRNLGGMVFGLHQIDGYYYYFGDDGALATADRAGTFKNVYKDYYADSNGYLYNDNTLMRDTSIAKSEYYTNTLYYDNVNLNNYYLANYDKEWLAKEAVVHEKENKKSKVDTSNATEGENKSADTHLTSGGTNYGVNAEGRVELYDAIPETKAAEKYGPMIQE